MKYIFILFIFFFSCEKNGSTQERNPYNFQENPDQVSINYSTTVSDLDKMKYKLWSGRLEFFSNTKQVLLKDSLRIIFFGDDESPASRVYANRGEWNQRNNNFFAKENVSLITEDGKTLFTDTLYYQHREQKLYSKTPVMFIDGNDTTWGDSFKSDVQLEELTIKNQRSIFIND
jgi:LPS export ABC transporter protein LptC